MSVLNDRSRMGQPSLARRLMVAFTALSVMVWLAGCDGAVAAVSPAQSAGPAGELCLTAAAGPAVTRPSGASVQRFNLIVPPGGATAPQTIRLKKGDEIDLVITSMSAGMATVHGLSDEVKIPEGGSATIPISVKHTGRFAVHFHAKDGAHLELAILEIWPQ